MSKRYFRVTLAGYGGEFTMGQVSEEFYERWKDTDDDEQTLGDFINDVDWEEGLEQYNSPDMTEHGNNSWHEFDELSHNYGCYSDSWYYVEEVDAPEHNAKILSNEERYEINAMIGYERYTCFSEDYVTVPVLMCHSGEKGQFGHIFVETDGDDFDPQKMSFLAVESDMCELVEGALYDGRQLDIEYDWCDTVGKSFFCELGRVNLDWLDPYPDEATISEYYDDFS